MRLTKWRAAILAAAMVCAPLAAAAQKISDLPAATTLGGTEQLRGIQGSGCLSHTTPCADVRVSPAQIATLANASLDAKLVAIAGLSPSADTCFYFTGSTAVASYSCPSFGRSIVTSSSASTARATLGAAASGSNSDITALSGLTTPLTVTQGGTGATSTSAARSGLGLAIGSNVQAWDADLDALAAVSGTNTIYYRSATNTWSPVTIGSNMTFSSGTLAATVGGSGTVNSVSVTTANGVSGSVATSTTTPAITLTLGAITPTSVASSGSVTGSNLSGTNTGDQTSVTGNAGTATKWATARNLSMTGDIAWTLTGVDGSANVTSTATLATVNSNVGTFGSGTSIPNFTVNAKGLLTAAGATALNSDLVAISALTPSNDDVLQRKAGAWTNRTIAQVKADLGLPQSADVQIFNVSGTWTKPAFGTSTRVLIWGGGGGGGNGAIVAASTVVSGGGGGGGVYGFDRTFSTSSLASTETVTVGSGGAAHATGGNSTFGSWVTSYGGGAGENGASGVGAGGGGSSGIWTAGSNASGATAGASSGSGSAAGGAAGAGAASSNFGSGGGGSLGSTFAGFGGGAGIIVPGGSSGGGAGGGISASNVAMAGAAGGVIRANSSGGAAGAINGGAGGAQTAAIGLNEGGGGGGGGGSATAANGGNGAGGQAPGGGGGGGGATQTGFTAGAGGAGGAGKVIVITI